MTLHVVIRRALWLRGQRAEYVLKEGSRRCIMGHIGEAAGVRLNNAYLPSWCPGPWPEGVLTPSGEDSQYALTIVDRNDSPDEMGREEDLINKCKLLDIELEFVQ